MLLYKCFCTSLNARFEESAPDRRKAKRAAASTFEPKILAPVLELETADDDADTDADTDTDDDADADDDDDNTDADADVDIERHEMQQFFCFKLQFFWGQELQELFCKTISLSQHSIDQLLMLEWDLTTSPFLALKCLD